MRVYEFIDPELGKVIPYGVYDVGKNWGWVRVGMDYDTSDFAIDSILSWWSRMGRKTYPSATKLPIMADGGGSNGTRSRLWKRGIQRLANSTGDHQICGFMYFAPPPSGAVHSLIIYNRLTPAFSSPIVFVELLYLSTSVSRDCRFRRRLPVQFAPYVPPGIPGKPGSCSPFR